MTDDKGIARAALGGMRRLGWPLFLVHVAWTALGFIVLAPLVGGMSRLLLSLSGETAVADQDIALFALTPLGLSTILFVAAVTVAILALEIASMMRILAGETHGSPVGTLGALRFATARAHRIVALALQILVRVLVLALPFLASGAAVAWFLLKDHDINYYLSRHPPAFWIAVAVIGGLLFVLLVLLIRKLVGWALALPLLLFARAGSRQALAESEGIVQGKWWEVFRALAYWAVAAFIFSAILIGGIHTLGSWLLPDVRSSLGATVLVLGVLALLFTLGNLLITGFNAALFSLIDLHLYERYGPGIAAGTLGKARADSKQRGWQWTGKRLVLALAVAALLAVLAGGWLLRGVRVDDDVEIIAHRGAAGAAPENTLASMQRGIEDETDWLELDVQETADGRVIVIHDSDFMKLAGVGKKVWDLSFDEARTIDIGSWFSPAFSDERVPTLKEVLELARGKAGVVIELKYYGHDQDLERRVIDIVEETEMVDSVQVMSLDYKAIQKVRALRPTWTVGLLTATAIGDLTTRDADFLAVSLGMVTSGFVKRAHKRGKKVYAWTANDAVTMSRLMSLGVDGVITDEPALARRVLAERAEMSAGERLLLHAAVLFDVEVDRKKYRDNSP